MSNIVKSDNSIMELLGGAVNGNAPVDVIEKLLALKKEHDNHIAKQEFFKDLALAKCELPSYIDKDKKVNFKTKNGGMMSYAHESLAGITSEVNPILSRHGLSVIFSVSQEKNITVTLKLCHRLGHIETVSMSGPADDSGNKNALQRYGSTVSYLMRYTMKLALGIATGDKDENDDGRNSVISEKEKKKIFVDAKLAISVAESREELIGIWNHAENNGLKGSVLMVQLKALCTTRQKQIDDDQQEPKPDQGKAPDEPAREVPPEPEEPPQGDGGVRFEGFD
jgi:hypothetical protein